MSEQEIVFRSDDLTLKGKLSVPAREGKHPAVVILHGFGSHMDAGNVRQPAAMLQKLGYATLRFDMRGCGESEGERGNLICLEQVADTKAAVTFLLNDPRIDSARIAVMGSSFGAAVAVYSTATDPRIAAVISASGWGHGERKFKGQHSAPGSYDQFIKMLDEAKQYTAETGMKKMVPRYEIVPIPAGLRGHVIDKSIQTFTANTAQSMFDFRPEDVVERIAPRPALFLHSSADSVTPVEQSMAMWSKAGQPAELHLFADTDHFMFAEENVRPRNVVADWLGRYFPVQA